MKEPFASGCPSLIAISCRGSHRAVTLLRPNILDQVVLPCGTISMLRPSVRPGSRTSKTWVCPGFASFWSLQLDTSERIRSSCCGVWKVIKTINFAKNRLGYATRQLSAFALASNKHLFVRKTNQRGKGFAERSEGLSWSPRIGASTQTHNSERT